MREDERDRVARQGTEAWRRLKKEKSWGDWLKVGEALQVGREWAMNQAGTNAPIGKAYNMAFGEWLTKYKLDDMDKGDRSRLFSVMDNLGLIEDWRKTLPLTERLKLNHPNAIWRRWKARMEPDKDGPSKPTLRDSVANLSEEVAARDRRIAELTAELQEAQAAREQATPALTLADAERFLIDHLDDLDDDERMAVFDRLLSPFELMAVENVRVDKLTWEKAALEDCYEAHVMSEGGYPYYFLSPSTDNDKLFGLSLVSNEDDDDEIIVDEKKSPVPLAKAKKVAQAHHDERGPK
jgi:hypothetical protein